MTITLKLYGELRKQVNESSLEKGFPATVDIEIGNLRKVSDVLYKLEIDEIEISHIFVNGVYSGSGTQIKEADRIGIFPSNMAVMFAEIPDINSIHIKVKVFGDTNAHEKPELRVKIPKGSTLKSIVMKLNLSKEVSIHKILVNGKQFDEYNSEVNAEDKVEIFLI